MSQGQADLWRARPSRFSELGGDRHLRGPMRQRVVSDTMHHRLVRQRVPELKGCHHVRLGEL